MISSDTTFIFCGNKAIVWVFLVKWPYCMRVCHVNDMLPSHIGISCDIKPLGLPGIVRHSTCAVSVFAAQVHGITIDIAVRLMYVFP